MLRFSLSVIILSLVVVGCGSESETPRTSDTVQQPAQPRQPTVTTEFTAEKIQIIEEAVFEDFDGNPVSLQDFEGKVVLIDLWETWCVPCLVSFPTLQSLMDDYPDKFVVLAVSPGIMDSPDMVREFAAGHPYTFSYVFGFDLADDLQIAGIPFKIYIAPDGSYFKHTVGSRGPERDYQDAVEVLRYFFEI